MKKYNFISILILFFTANSFAAIDVSFKKSISETIKSRPGGLTAPATFKRISQAHKYLAANKYDKALAKLRTLDNNKTKPYSKAQVYQTMGYVYSGQGKDSMAAKYFQKSLDLNVLPIQPTKTNLYMLSQLYIGAKKYDLSLRYIKKWFNISDKPTAPAYILLATALSEKNRKDEALTYVNKAVAISTNPKESWLQFAAGLNIEKGYYKKAIFALNRLVKINPKKATYWKMLAGAHLNLEENKQALNAMSIANQLGFLTSEHDILNLASLYATNGIPLSSAILMEKSIKSGKVKKTKKNLQFLAQAWLDSEDKQKAIKHLRQAAAQAPDGKLYVLEGQVYMEKGKWLKAAKAFTQALNKGKLSNKGQIYMLRGMAYTNAKKFESAKNDFDTLGTYPQYTSQSTSWLNYLKFKEDAIKILTGKSKKIDKTTKL